MSMHEQWRLHCTSWGGGDTIEWPHVYCVAITLKVTEQVEQQICIKFCVRLQHSPQKLFRWFRRSQLWATSDWQLHHNNVPTHAFYLMWSFGQNIKSLSWLNPPRAHIRHPATSGFSQNWNPLWKGRDFFFSRLSVRFRKIRWGSWWWFQQRI